MRTGLGSRRSPLPFVIAAALFAGAAMPPEAARNGPQFHVRFGPETSAAPLDGRLLVLVSTDPSDEPRFQMSDGNYDLSHILRRDWSRGLGRKLQGKIHL